jgi:calcineurin-like phosphoesterase family protein
MGRDEEMHELYIKPYRFKKILVRGNHDHRSDNWYLNHGWDFVVSTFSARYFGCDLIFSHRPMGEVPEGHLNIHGHLHDGHRDGYSSWAKDSFKHKLVALELQGYEAINLRRFLNV